MEDNNKIEIIDDTNVNTSENNTSEVVEMPKNINENNVVPNKEVVLETKIDKKKLKEEIKRQKQEEKRLKKEAKKKKKNKDEVTSNVYENMNVEVVETAIARGASGSKVIGDINGDTITPNNETLPSSIDITVKPKTDSQNNVKKVKVVTKKEKIISVIVSIFVILVLGGAGYAAYYFGYETNPSIYSVKNLTLELGDELPSTVSYFVTSPHEIDDMEYSLDLSRVSKDIVGTYTYSVIHKSVVKTGQIIIRDTIAPKLAIKDKEDLIYMKNSTVNKEDIVTSCEDISNCTYKLEYVVDTSTPGDKQVKIIAKDDQGNETDLNVTIKIVDVQKTLLCISPQIPSDDGTYSTREEYSVSFDSNDYLVLKSGNKRYLYSDYTAYFVFLNDNENNNKYEFDRMTFSYLTKSEVNTNNLTSFNDLMSYYTDMGYVCSEK